MAASELKREESSVAKSAAKKIDWYYVRKG